MQTATAIQKKENHKIPASTPTLTQTSLSRELAGNTTAGVPLFMQRMPISTTPQCSQCESEEEEVLKQPVFPKLTVGSPDDEYEQEADRVADTVMRMPESNDSGILEETDEEEIVQTKPLTPRVQCETVEKEDDEQAYGSHELVQGKSEKKRVFSGSQEVDDTINSSGGSRMPKHVESRISKVLGADLSHVKVHDNPDTNKVAQSIHAKAFTHGNHIYLGANQTSGDVGLMAHEAAHVVQQGSAPRVAPRSFNTFQSKPPVTNVVNNYIQRKNPFRIVPAETPRTVAQINAMTLSDFQELTLRQLDWATSPHLTAASAAADLANFRQVLSFSYESNILTTCGDMPVGQIISAGLPGVFTHLRNYARGAVSTRTTAWLRQTNSVTDAVNWGTDLPGLEGACTQGTLNQIMPPPTPLGNPSVFEQLVTASRTVDFINYVTTCSPILSATNGREIESYLALRGEGADPAAYSGRITYVRNFHRFTRPALDGIVANESVTAASQRSFWSQRPLTLVLYSALDHNGAFHRMPGITQMILQPRILTIILEGLGTLGGYEGLIAPISARYGIDGRIDQALIAGHGSATGIELAGSESGGTITRERLEGNTASPHYTATENLIDELVNNMSLTPADRRIVLYACLTASNEVDPAGISSTNPALAASQIQSSIIANPNIRDFIAGRAGTGATVLGSQASQWATGFLTPGTIFTPPRLTLQTPHDQFIAAPKIDYVEFGPECGGAVRALVECWANDIATSVTTCRDAVKRRLGRAATKGWDEHIVRGIFEVALKSYWANGNMLAQFVNITDWLSYFEHDPNSSQATQLWNNVASRLSATDVLRIFTSLSTTTNWIGEPRLRLIFNQSWMQYDTSKQGVFMTALNTFSSCGDVRRYVDMSLVRPGITTFLPAAPASSPPAGELIIAIMEAIANPVTTPLPATLPHHIQYLHTLLGTATNFRPALNISGIASGFTTEDAILTAIGKGTRRRAPSTSGSGSSPPTASLPAANVDLNRDTTNMNDFYLEPFLRTGRVDNCSRLNVRERPWMARRVDRIPRGHVVHIVGRHRNWYGIEHNGLIRFVYKDYITLIP